MIVGRAHRRLRGSGGFEPTWKDYAIGIGLGLLIGLIAIAIGEIWFRMSK